MIDALLDKAAAELVEELLASCAKEGSEPWFNIVRRKLEKVSKQTQEYNPPKRRVRALHRKHRGVIQTAAGPACKECGRGVNCWLAPDESPCQHR